jgi:hypothetical protein
MKIQLKKALRHKGQELLELDIPLENLTGSDLIEVEQQIFRAGKITLMADYSKVYLIRVAARAAKIPVEVMENLSARDFTVVANQVQNFLMGSDSETETSESELETTPEIVPATSSKE